MQIYNLVSNKLTIDYEEPICNRAKLDTGTHCNYRCSFCYYRSKLDEITPFEVIKQRIDYLISCGITEVDLSGGESSIHNNWFDILSYCKNHGLRISTLSNGYKFANKDFLARSVEAGLEEILFSVHGYDRESHNSLVNNRHGYDKIVQAISNAHELGVRVRINCTVTHQNYKHLATEFVELMHALKPLEVNFLTLNYWDDAGKIECIEYGLVTPYIQRAIDALKDTVRYINVRYTPYCYMEGYEQYVCNYYQHIYDVFDWNIAVYNQTVDPATYRSDPHAAMFKAAAAQRNRTYAKKKECMQCKHFYMCDGVEKQFTNVDLHPSPGDYITQVNFYRKGLYANTQHTDSNA